MNEKITELAVHCDFYVGNEHYDKPYEQQQMLFMEKFAELIIQECISKYDEWAEYSTDKTSFAMAKTGIKKKFEIEL
jgi:hypothetical protein